MMYWIGRFLSLLLFKTVFRVRVSGRENLPREGGCIVAANHNSYLDPPLVGSSLPRKVYFMAKEELFRVPVLGLLLWSIDTFPVRRGVADRQAIKKALALLQKGEVVGIFPEGGRVKPGEIKDGELGAALLALKARVPVVPASIQGNAPWLKMEKGLPRISSLLVKFGEPIPPPTLRPGEREKEALKETTRVLMEAISSLREES